ncbi:DUF4910 domain-containing protein [Candidatus Margulisiibacteriota bacterium]
MNKVPENIKNEMWQLLETLFPISRSILGPEYQRSLEIISEIIPIKVLEFSSGSKCGSWTIPKEWKADEAYIADVTGKKIVDLKNNSLHLCQYSQAYKGRVSREELLKHIITHPEQPDAIPLDVAFYRDRWGFCLSQNQMAQLSEPEYDVVIRTRHYDGKLRVGELYLPGRSKKEILIDAVLSCPSVANNLSGVVVAVYLMKLLAEQKDRRWSYRLLLTPETIGPITLGHLSPDKLNNVIGGYTLVNLADMSDIYHYRKSRQGNTLADQVISQSLKRSGNDFVLEDYDVRTGSCGNEKAYNSLGLEVPVGSFRRSHLGSYPEYDTSLDDLGFVDQQAMLNSFKVIWQAIEYLEQARIFKHTFTGEPFLTGYGLFPKIANDRDRLPWDYLMAYTNGRLSLTEIADRAGLPLEAFDEPVAAMLEHGLIKEVK